MFHLFSVKSNKKSGFTLIEALIGAFVLFVVSGGIYEAYVSIMKLTLASRVKTDAMLLANEQVEIARNLPYQDVGILNGVPVGKIPREQTLVRGGNTFQITASVRNVDDPFDGTLGDLTKNDLAPADYKLVEYDIFCLSCRDNAFSPQKIVTTIAPRGLEITTGNGALFVKVFNANGDPVPGARVHVENSLSSPTISIDELTDNNGMFQLVDTPPGNFSYKISVSKAGYSSDRTYPSTSENPNPISPDRTVSAGQLTQASFSIDELSKLKISTLSKQCAPLSSVEVRIQGGKKIGQGPDILKYDRMFISDANGQINLPDLEWDTYSFSLPSDSSRSVAGTLPLAPLLVTPGSDEKITLVLVPKVDRGLLVSVRDAATGLPLLGALVTVGGQTLTTNEGYFSQTDWSAGDGQTIYDNFSKFADSDGNIDFSQAGEIKLRESLGQYVSSGYLASSVYDAGSTSTVYASLRWSPSDQATSTGSGSVRFQLASGNDPATTTWRFLGPDGTQVSYYETVNSAINSIHNGDRYIRYKIFLSTADQHYSPNISDVSLTYTSACTPPGQAYFSGLTGTTENIHVSRPGYQSYSGEASLLSGWQTVNVFMETE